MVIALAAVLLSLPVAYWMSIQLDDVKIRREFLDKNPDVEIISSGVGEGDFDNAWYHIKYRKPESLDVHESIVLYQRKGRDWETSSNLKVP